MIDNTYPGKVIARNQGSTATYYEDEGRIILVVEPQDRQFSAGRALLDELEREMKT